MPVDTELDTPPKATAVRPFQQVADETPPVDSQSAGYATMQEMGEQAQRDKDRKKANGFFSKASGDGGRTGFSLAGTDASGNGFNLPLSSPGLLGGKWTGVQPKWVYSDQHTMQHAPHLNKSFDKIIKRAIQNNWTHIAVRVGIGPGQIDAPGPLTRALNRRIHELANGGKEADKAIRAMGFHPEKVRAQLAGMQSHSAHINDVMEAIQKSATPAGGAAPTFSPPCFSPF